MKRKSFCIMLYVINVLHVRVDPYFGASDLANEIPETMKGLLIEELKGI